MPFEIPKSLLDKLREMIRTEVETGVQAALVKGVEEVLKKHEEKKKEDEPGREKRDEV